MSGSIDVADGTMTIIRGDTFHQVLRRSTKVDGVKTPVDLTGSTIKAQVRSKVDGYIVLELEIQPIDLENGTFALHASEDDTKLIRLTSAVWDLQFTYPDGTVDTKIEPAPVIIIKDVTK